MIIETAFIYIMSEALFIAYHCIIPLHLQAQTCTAVVFTHSLLTAEPGLWSLGQAPMN